MKAEEKQKERGGAEKKRVEARSANHGGRTNAEDEHSAAYSTF